jgi:hypothetical protein
MSTGAIVGIIIAVVIVAAVIVFGAPLLRQMRMRRQFGPEYDRLAKELGSRKAAAELTARQHRADALGIHPLTAEQQASYSDEWTAVQERFVDAPAAAVSAADTLIWDVMADRGYPADQRDASLEALSVYHARLLDGYRKARDITTESASTEELRTALIRHRALFQDLVGVLVGPRGSARRAATATKPAGTDGRTRRIAIVPSKTAGTPH